MADNNESVFFIDDELVERLMRGDTADVTKKQARPSEVNALVIALRLANAGQLDEAVMELESAVAQGQNPADIYGAIGHIRFEQQQWEAATDCYVHVAETDEKHPTAFYNLGLCLERRAMYEEAVEAFETAISIDGQRWQAQLGRGLCLLQLGKFEQPVRIRIARCSERP
jgi:tetratricopeptide (TPR) repeat protein